MVPASTLMYGSILSSVTRKPRASSSEPMEAAARPLPRDDTTPPVTKMNFGVTGTLLSSSALRSNRRRPRAHRPSSARARRVSGRATGRAPAPPARPAPRPRPPPPPLAQDPLDPAPRPAAAAEPRSEQRHLPRGPERLGDLAGPPLHLRPDTPRQGPRDRRVEPRGFAARPGGPAQAPPRRR